MNTPIANALEEYAKSDFARLHMPGHKGKAHPFDITEICGADSLYEADGIIAESEENATKIFGSKQTFYSTEGSSQCIKAMLMLAVQNRENKKEKPLILAARNVHKSFLSAAALIDFSVEWLMPKETNSICSCDISPDDLKEKLDSLNKKPCAVFITSPDYLGNVADIKGLSAVCKEYNIPLVCDNAHGAYLKFFGMHPIDLGADMCCDSAHKTLPVLTGGAYLHINNDKFLQNVKETLCLFGSTSPSYLILNSLDLANEYMAKNGEKFVLCAKRVEKIKSLVNDVSDEPLKITIDANKLGYSGFEIANILRKEKIECEYSDEQFVVLMFSPFNSEDDFERVENVIKSIEKREEIKQKPLFLPNPEAKMTIRQAYFSKQEECDVQEAVGRVCGFSTVSCPPAIPIALSGEIITEEHIELFKNYGIKKIKVVAY